MRRLVSAERVSIARSASDEIFRGCHVAIKPKQKNLADVISMLLHFMTYLLPNPFPHAAQWWVLVFAWVNSCRLRCPSLPNVLTQ